MIGWLMFLAWEAPPHQCLSSLVQCFAAARLASTNSHDPSILSRKKDNLSYGIKETPMGLVIFARETP